VTIKMATEQGPNYTLSGRITSKQGERLRGLIVRAGDRDDPLGKEVVTDTKGRYKITLTEKELKISGMEGGGTDVFIRVYDGDKLLAERPVRPNAGERTTVHFRVGFHNGEEPREPAFSVSGDVTQGDGRTGISAACVRAHDQGLRHRGFLGEATTDANGRYVIRYAQTKLLDPKRGSANLIVEVIGDYDRVLATSEVRFKARRQESIRLKVDPEARSSEWERVNTRLLSILGETPFTEVTDKDVGFLEKSTGLTAEQVKQRIHAAKAAAQSGLPEWFHYALLRQGLPGGLEALLAIPVSRVREALAAAEKAAIVSPPPQEEIADLWQRLEKLQTKQALDKPLPGRRLKIGQVLGIVGLDEKVQGDLARALASKDLRDPAQWTALQTDTSLEPAMIARVEFAVRAAELTDDHVGALTALLRDKRVSSLRDLARDFGPDSWRELVEKAVAKDGDDLPKDVPGDTPEERRARFADRLFDRVAEAHPDVAVIYGLTRHAKLAAKPAGRVLPAILETDAGFDLAKARIDAYVREHKADLGIADTDEAAVLEDLKRVQRVYRLRAEPRAVTRLLEDGLDSSSAILSLGREGFLEKYGKDEAFGLDVAKQIYARAETNAARAMAVYARFSPIINTGPAPGPVAACPAALKGVPNYTTLFGSLDGCDCDPCESVYSPAAYLTDLLAFVKHEVKAGPASFVADGLEGLKVRSFCDCTDHLVDRRPRRPDILDTKLSCRNAETLLPYVDLVLEILENAVTPRSDGVPQTTMTADQLAAQPEHAIPAAYNELANAIFPFSLPFDLWHQEAAIYLEEQGTRRVELLEILFPFADVDTPHDNTEIRRWQDTTIAAARLGLTEVEWNLIAATGLTSAQSTSAAWGYAPDAAGDWWHPLRMVDTFLHRSGLEYKDLLRLLRLNSFNPQHKLKLKFDDVTDCDPQKIRIENLDPHALSYLHRFLRLQRALGWSLQQMDQALLALSPGVEQGRAALNQALLVRLSHVLKLRERFALPLPEILSWWSGLDTADRRVPQLPHETPEPSLYESMFLKGRAGEAQYDAFQLNTGRSELRDATKPLRGAVHLAAIAGALRLSVPDVEELTRKTITDPGPKLTLANLSILFRNASLARALRLSVADYLTLRTLIGFDPFVTASGVDKTIQTLRFVERAELVQASGFSIAELDYILRQTAPYESGKTVAPTDAWVAASLAALRAAVEALAPFDRPRATLQQAIDILGAGPGTAATADDLRPLIEQALEQLGAAGEVGTDNSLDTLLHDALNLVSPGATIDHARLYPKLTGAKTILESVLNHGLATALGEALGVPAATALALLQCVVAPAGTGERAGDVLLRAFTPSGQSSAALPTDQALALLLRRLHKAVLVVARLEIDHKELPRLVAKAPAAGWLDLTALAIHGTVAAPAFESWARLVRLFQFRNTLLPEQRQHVFELFKIADEFQPGTTSQANQWQDYIAKLAELSGWSPDDIAALVMKSGVAAVSNDGGILKANFPEQFTDERLPRRILAAIMLLRRLGLTALHAQSWIARPLNHAQRSAQVEAIKQALKARLGESWPDRVKKLRDPLRERQRQALVAYLLDDWNLAEPADLFDHFLIDVEMSPCMMTSRLIQATTSVQLFVQRILMNLEPGLALSEEGAEQWEWMKNYRVWEANRKIFLYPENWIDPDLRDDKTPFFKDLENELRQADLTNETALTAVLHYLEKLHEVSRLQVCGQYLELDNLITLHVFARTRDVPHHYYYRRAVVEIDIAGLRDKAQTTAAIDANWTPWERVTVDVEGDHLIPVVYNRRVYLFWPVFTSEDEAPMTHTFQSILSLIGKLMKLQIELGNLIHGIFKGMGVAIIGATTNSIVSLLQGLDGMTILEADVVDLSQQVEEVRKIRTDLLSAFGLDPSISSDVTEDMVRGAVLPDISDLQAILDSIGNILEGYEGYLLSFLPAKRLQVQMAWSEYKGDSWSAKKTSANVVSFRDMISTLFENLPTLPGLGSKGVKRLFTFHARVNQDNQLTVHCRVALPTSVLNPATYTSGQWLSEPKEIGHFRMNTCSGKVEAVDSSETMGFIDLFSQATSQMFLVTISTVQSLRDDRQLQQRGEPITPDDDPRRPSAFRNRFENGPWSPLPHHSIPGQGEDPYRLLTRHQDVDDRSKLFGFFYHDASRTFLCAPCPFPKNNPGKPWGPFGYVFFPFYHPYSCELLANLQRFGIPGIYDVRFRKNSAGHFQPAADGKPLQLALKDDEFFRPPEYAPIDHVYNPPNGPRALRPIEEINFSTIGAYAQYNWEIFFHIPFLTATRLATNQKCREAQRWFHYIFNPTDASQGSVPEKYWRTRPFVETSSASYEQQQIEELLQMLNAEAETPGLQELEWAVRKWRNDAFNPHLVARARTVAFQKAVVMKYIDNLIAWGDSLFHQETREAVNEATQLYILAAKLLGPRPRRIPKGYVRTEYSYAELTRARPLDAFSNALVEIESLLPASGVHVGREPYREADHGRLDRVNLAPVGNAWKALIKSRSLLDAIRHNGDWHKGHKPSAKALYFHVPPNDKLLEKWDLVADRLFKIRHCQNIKGQGLQLPLLAPAIDPAILVRAKALGVDVDSMFSQLYTPLPHYRFQVLAQKASELCGEVKSLGAALLSALEKRDGEALALLRNTQETRLLMAVQTIKEKQIEEAKLALQGLRHSRAATTLKRDHHQRLLMEFMNPEEIAHTVLGASSLMLQIAQFGVTWGASAASLLPNIKAGFVTTLGLTYGGENVKGAAENAAQAIGLLSSIFSSAGGLISTMGGYRRRAEEWLLQIALANKELDGMAKQIAAAETRVAIAEADLENHKLQIRNNQETTDFMQQKFTNQELYDWMVTQTSTLYFQSYQLAYELAKQCERTFAHELGVDSPGHIQPGYWDSLKKGLLAGEHLHHSLKRLEVAYLNQNKREFELTKHISLALLDPLALVKLRETGQCFINLPEELFDLDYPGHYFRRIKSVSITLPCVVGPYTTVSCTLRLLTNSIRISIADGDNGYRHNRDSQGLPTQDTRFVENNIAARAIAASNAQNDSGVFELDFRDERYLPFEGAGAISNWSLELFNDDNSPDFGKPLRQFDYSSISDAILHVNYTAREDDGAFKDGALSYLRDYFQQDGMTTFWRMFNLSQEFPSQWHRFVNPTNPANGNVFELEMSPKLFRILDGGKTLKVNSIVLLARCANTGSYDVVLRPPLPAPPPAAADKITLAPLDRYGGLHFGQKDAVALGIEVVPTDPPAKWQLKMTRPGGGNLQQDPVSKTMEVEDVLLILGYEWQ
jgi:hypothetical protein